MNSRHPLLVRIWLCSLIVMSCSSYTDDIGGGFVVRTRVRHGMAHEYNERDLYHKGFLGIHQLIHKDISGAEVSSTEDTILFFARRHKPEPMAMDEILYVFDQPTGSLTKIAEGEFDYTHNYWSPTGRRLVYRKYYEPIMLYDLATDLSREIAGKECFPLLWSPSGQKIAYATGRSVYDVNSLYSIDVEELKEIPVAEKEGGWRKDDIEWVTVDGEEMVVVKESGR